ncbi:MAG: T9SS type B sorting domain-containing protein, partial [Flavobacterium sp.]|nr:T9SS type B sorting domain-containing protein [Flavobacterium sp.]
SVASSVLTSCATLLSSQVIINVNPNPVVVISGNSTICTGYSTILTFTGTPDAIVTYTVNGGTNQNITLNNTGVATLSTGNLLTNISYTLINIALPGSARCTQSLTQIFTIALSLFPTASIIATSTSVCSGYSTTLNFSGTPNAVVTYSINSGVNQFITLNNVGLETVSSANLYAPTTYQLLNAALPGAQSCSQTISGTAQIAINQSPIASFSGAVNYCSGKPLNISLISNIPGTTFTWAVVENGISGATPGTGNTINHILIANAVDGNAIYTITPTYNGCVGTIIQIIVTIHALPKPILTNGVICLNSSSLPSSQFYTLSTGLNSMDYSFEWFLNSVIIPSASTSSFKANQVGNYSVIATNILTGCNSGIVFASVTESIKGESLIIDQTAFFNDQPTVTVTVVGGDGPFSYQIDDAEFQSSNVFSAVPSGSHTINVVDETFCTNLTTSTTIINYPHFFTPNGDGFHDYWNIDGLSSTSKILIFDRFGKLIKQIFTNSNGWDGTFEGQAIFADNYWFVINYIENGLEKIFKAHFALKR